jgi:hypothetical protein
VTNIKPVSFSEGDEVDVNVGLAFNTGSGISSGTEFSVSKIQITDLWLAVQFTGSDSHVSLAFLPWGNVDFISSSGSGSVPVDFSDLSLSESGGNITVQFVPPGGGLGVYNADSLEMRKEGVTFQRNASGTEVTEFIPWCNVVAIVQEVS